MNPFIPAPTTATRPITARALLVTLALFAITLTSCNDSPVADRQTGDEGLRVLIFNEGNFSDANGTVTSYYPGSGERIADLFQQVNGRLLAGTIQFATRTSDRLYIVTNNQNKIEVVDPVSFKSLDTILIPEGSGITPIAIEEISPEKAYLSSLYDTSVYVVDLAQGELTETQITVGNNPQQMVLSGLHLFVANSGFGSDNTVSVIDPESDSVIHTIQVGAGPTRLVDGGDGRLWVVAGGYEALDEETWERVPEKDIPGRIDVIDAVRAEHLAVVETGGYPRALALDPSTSRAWVVNDSAVQSIDMESYTVTDSEFIPRSFSAIGFSPEERLLYLAENRGYVQDGQILITDREGAPVDSFRAGIAPRDLLFLPAP